MSRQKYEQTVASIDGSRQYNTDEVAAAYGVSAEDYRNQVEVAPHRRRISAKLGAAARMAYGPLIFAAGVSQVEAQTGAVSRSAEFMADNPTTFGMAVGSAALLGASIYGRRKIKQEKAAENVAPSDTYNSQNY